MAGSRRFGLARAQKCRLQEQYAHHFAIETELQFVQNKRALPAISVQEGFCPGRYSVLALMYLFGK